MKFNSLYILIPLAIGGSWWITRDLLGQSEHTFFATAESEAQMLSFDHAVVVQDLRVATGGIVKKGDTLAILFRSELDRTSLEKTAEIRQIEVENASKNTVIAQQRDLIEAKKNAQIQQIQAEIQVLQTEDSLQNNLRTTVFPQSKPQPSVRQTRIAALSKSVGEIEKQAQEQIAQLQTQQKSNTQIEQGRVALVKQNLAFVAIDRQKLALIAPMDGFVEQLLVAKGSFVSAFKDMIKINPKQPNRVIGFIHETANVPFQLGDSVLLQSFSRPTVNAPSKIVGCSPKLVELPLRLRKFQELRAWGRELYLDLPDSNRFYIGEKISVTIKIKK
ncbi:MAG: hypothetical protein RL757_1572 [Bacteroidota bacterium]|jgi:multidrug resistance efflux pump